MLALASCLSLFCAAGSICRTATEGGTRDAATSHDATRPFSPSECVALAVGIGAALTAERG